MGDLEYVDLLLVHNPVCNRAEYKPASMPHFFELFNQQKNPMAITLQLPDGEETRPLLIEKKMQDHRDEGIDFKECYEQRKRCWLAMEKALKDGKTKMIGVSNYPACLIKEMESYATIM